MTKRTKTTTPPSIELPIAYNSDKPKNPIPNAKPKVPQNSDKSLEENGETPKKHPPKTSHEKKERKLRWYEDKRTPKSLHDDDQTSEEESMPAKKTQWHFHEVVINSGKSQKLTLPAVIAGNALAQNILPPSAADLLSTPTHSVQTSSIENTVIPCSASDVSETSNSKIGIPLEDIVVMPKETFLILFQHWQTTKSKSPESTFAVERMPFNKVGLKQFN